jgi:transcriptional regulator with XRE-family HTH domain
MGDRELSAYAVAIDVLHTLPADIRTTRAARGISYRTAAKQIGIAPSSLYTIESGRRSPSTVVVLRVLRWLDGPPEEG